MTPQAVGALTFSLKPSQDGGAYRSFLKALLLACTLTCCGLATGPASANLVITTTGTITMGTETGGLFGLPSGTTNLTGPYTLIVEFDQLGPNFFTSGDGMFSSDFESPGVTGSVTAIVNGQSLTTTITNSVASLLLEDLSSFFTENVGTDTTGAFVDVSQNLLCASPCVPFADLGTSFHYTLGPGDVLGSMDSYTFQGAAFPASGTPMATFTGTEATFAFVPEPSSSVLFVTALLGLTVVIRRRA
jgi:hypothetical protein